MNIEEIIALPEGTTLEFKENLNSEQRIIETIIGFANASGGRIIVGVSDKDRHVVGIDNPHHISEMIASKIHDSIEPRILPNIDVISYRNIYLLSIEIYPSSLRPHFLKAKGKNQSTYIRIGATTRLADDDLIKAIQRSTSNKSFDEELCGASDYSDIDFEPIAQLFKHIHTIEPKELISLGLVVKNGNYLVPTNAGIILFASTRLTHFPDAWIQVGVFDGNDKSHIIDTHDIKSYLPYAIEETLNFIKRNIRVGLEIKDIRNAEHWEIPKTALREAIINAVVHTDYSLKGAPIRVSIFNDRIEIENSALLPWGLTFNDLQDGISKLRNPTIGRVFKEIGFIEQWGSGIRRMITACENAGVEVPQFKEVGPRIRVIFNKMKNKIIELDATDQLIVELLKLYGALSTRQFTDCFDISKRAVINRLSRLMNMGYIFEISKSANDPQKKYDLVNKGDKLTMKTLLETAECFMKEFNFYIQLKLDKGKHINLIFSPETIDDYFLNNAHLYERNMIFSKIKHVMLTHLIFGKVLLDALNDPRVKEAFKQESVANYNITDSLFNKTDFR